MLVLTGPSASGKTEIAKILIEKYNMKKMVTYTTRPMRTGEENGVDYNFVSLEQFLKMKDSEEFVETTYYNFNYYGSRKKDISNDKVVILDPNGHNKFYDVMGSEIFSVFLDTPEAIRIQRMIQRDDPMDIIERRIPNDRNIFHKDRYDNIDFIVKNFDIDLESLADKIYIIYNQMTKITNIL